MTIASDPLTLLGAAVVGLAVGLFFFGGLWLTVRALPTARHPALLALGSYLGRVGVSLLAFYWVMGGRWERLATALLGLIAMRLLLIRRWGPERMTQHPSPSTPISGEETDGDHAG